MFYLFKYLFSQENKQLMIDWTWEFNLKSLLNCICVRLCEPINYWYIFIYQLNTWYPFVIWQKYIILFSTQQFYLPDILIYILDPKNDPYRFKGEGVVFNAKLIGASDVPEARGDRMCQETILAQKMAVKTSGQHKQRIIINISEEGIKLIDLRTAVSVTITHRFKLWGMVRLWWIVSLLDLCVAFDINQCVISKQSIFRLVQYVYYWMVSFVCIFRHYYIITLCTRYLSSQGM